jgi:hypothetical protein
MHDRIDAVAASPPGRLLPVEPIQNPQHRPDERKPASDPPGASYTPRADVVANTYAMPVRQTNFVEPDPVAPALAEALAAEPWGHPMPAKAVWEQAAAARERAAAQAPAAVTVAAASPAPASVGGADSTTTSPATAVATTAAAPATHAAAVSAGSAAPVFPAWLTSLLKAR